MPKHETRLELRIRRPKLGEAQLAGQRVKTELHTIGRFEGQRSQVMVMHVEIGNRPPAEALKLLSFARDQMLATVADNVELLVVPRREGVPRVEIELWEVEDRDL